MIQGKDTAETIRLTANALGISEMAAAEIVAVEMGQTNGDVVTLDDDGNEIETPPGKQIDEK